MNNFGVSVERLADWRMDPRKFVREVWPGTVPDAWQDDGLAEFGNQKPIVRQSFQGPTGNGKSALMVWCGLNFLTTYGEPAHHPIGKCLAVTRENLEAHLWTEYARWINASPLMSAMFEHNSERIYARHHPETWWLKATGYPKDADDATLGRTLSGLHEWYVLEQIDESGAVPPQLINVADQAASTSRILRIQQSGNPLSRKGMLFAVTRSPLKAQWSIYAVSADPDDPKRTPRVPVAWAREKIEAAALGRDDPWVRAYVLGQFPDGDIAALLTEEDVERAMCRAPRKDAFDWAAKVVSADVGREIDPSAVCRRQGCIVYPIEERRGLTGQMGASWMADAASGWGGVDGMLVDGSGGHGWSWIEPLNARGHSVIPVIYSSAPANPRFGNLRAEGWWKMAEAIRDNLALPRDPLLAEELLAVTYFISERNDKFFIEDKEDTKATLGRSPNRADSLAQHFMVPIQPRRESEVMSRMSRPSGASVEVAFDPLARYDAGR